MVSVILVTYNSMNVLPACLRSLEKCTNPNEIEIVLVDNQSNDETWQWISRYMQREKNTFANIKGLQLEENKGYAFANNRGVDISGGDIILLLNPDTIVGTDAIKVCRDKLVEGCFGGIGCQLTLQTGKLDLACHRSFPTLWNSFCRFSLLSRFFPKLSIFSSYNMTYLDDKASYSVDCLCGAFLMLPRSVYISVGGLDEDYFMYGEDIEICYRIKEMGYQIWYEGSQSTVHLKGGNGGKRSVKSLYYFYDSMLVYYRKRYKKRNLAIAVYFLQVIVMIMFWINVLYSRMMSFLKQK